MSIISRITTWVTNQVLTSAALNAEFSNITNVLNNVDAGTTTWTNVNATSSTITTLANILMKYRRPVLQYSSATVVLMEQGLTGTASQAQIVFPDGTIRTDSTSGRINCNLAQNAIFLSGTAQGGLRTGAVGANTWYAFYAVKSQVNTTDIVHVADTVIPTQANYATLNTNFGTNGWVYLGELPYGDNSAATTAIPLFDMSGNVITFRNTKTGAVRDGRGLRLASTASASSVTWTYAAGTALGSAQIPAHILIGSLGASMTGGTVCLISNSAASQNVYEVTLGGTNNAIELPPRNLSSGLKIVTTAAQASEVALTTYFDGVLGIGANPIL